MISPDDDDFKGYAVIDLETTGLGHNARIVEIGIVLLSPQGEIMGAIETLIQPLSVMRASQIHGITEEMVEYAPTMELIIPGLLATLDGRVLVAHNANMEARFLNKELECYGVPVTTSNFIDTLKIARKHLNPIENHKLGTIAKYYGIEIKKPHQAFDDALATALVLKRMIEDYPNEVDAAPIFINGYENQILDKTLLLPR